MLSQILSLLFNRDEKTIRKHVNNVFSEGELEKDNNTQKMRVDGVKQKVPFPDHRLQVAKDTDFSEET